MNEDHYIEKKIYRKKTIEEMEKKIKMKAESVFWNE